MTAWHVRITYTGTVTPDDTEQAATTLAAHSPAFTINQDGNGGSVALFVDADRATDASTLALDLASPLLGDREVVGIEAQTEDAFFAALDRPAFPEVVGYAEIADMAGLSRQRVRQLAGSDGFPAAVIETAQGPLMPRAAAEHWVRTRRARVGRPRKVTA